MASRKASSALNGFGAFGTHSRSRNGLPSNGTIVSASGSLLGSDYHFGDHSVFTRGRVLRFLETIPRNRTWSFGGWPRRKLFPAKRVSFRGYRLHPWTSLCSAAGGSQRVSFRGSYANNRTSHTAHESPLASRLSSIRRGFHWNCSRSSFRNPLARGRRPSVSKLSPCSV
jgi:hypothetical protein